MAADLRGINPRSALLTLHIKDKNALYTAFMPFVKGGGLFVVTDQRFHIGDEVFILLTLMDDTERHSVNGRVVWITPRGTTGKRSQGVGVQFLPPDGLAVQKKLEVLLAGLQDSARPTQTL